MKFKFDHTQDKFFKAIGVSQDQWEDFFNKIKKMEQKFHEQLLDHHTISKALEYIINQELTNDELKLWVFNNLKHEHDQLFKQASKLKQILEEHHECEHCTPEQPKH